MKSTIDLKRFRDSVQTAALVSPSNAIRPVATRLLLDFDKREVTGTDLERWVSVELPEATLGGCVTVEAKRLGQALSILRGDDATIEVGRDKVQLSGSGGKFSFPSTSPDDFPRMPSKKKPVASCAINATALCSAFASTQFAIDETNNRYALGGVLLGSDGELRTVATDGRRCVSFATNVPCAELGTTIGPRASVALLCRVASRLTGDVTIDVESSAVVVSGCGACVRSPLLEGRFPDIAPIMDSKPELTCTLQVDSLLAALDACSVVFAKDTEGDMVCSVDLSHADGSMRLSATSAEVGEADAEIPVACEKFRTVTLNATYLRQFLATLGKGSTVAVHLGTEGATHWLGGASHYVLMPMETN